MTRRHRLRAATLGRRAAVVLLACCAAPASVFAQEHPFDVSDSTMTVRVFRSGLFSFMAHNHEIEAPIADGKVVLSDAPSVQVKVDARRLRVLDPELSDKDRAEVRQTMEGPKVLDVARFPEILFRSTTVEEEGTDRWEVRGDLTLHGQTRPVTVEVRLEDGRYRGTAGVRQQDFGIQPVSFGLGTVRVKNEVKIEFDIALTGEDAAGSGGQDHDQ